MSKICVFFVVVLIAAVICQVPPATEVPDDDQDHTDHGQGDQFVAEQGMLKLLIFL